MNRIKTKLVVVAVVGCLLGLPSVGQAQKMYSHSRTITGSWSLDTVSLVVIANDTLEIPVNYKDVRAITGGVFDRLTIDSENQCTMTSRQYQLSTSYTLTDDLFTVQHDTQIVVYQYHCTELLFLTRTFQGQNTSGELVNYKLSIWLKQE